MEFLKSVFTHPAFYGFVGGLIVGVVFLVMGQLNHFRTKRELKKFQKHLGDKLELEGEHLARLKADLEKMRGENENLRMKVGVGAIQNGSQGLERELELYARAEKTMILGAPGFAQAWEAAKDSAHRELQEEERGKSLPRRIFRKFFAAGHAGDPGAKMLQMKEGEATAAGGETAGH
jgi:hypothetical protein